MQERFAVNLTPLPTAARVTHQRRALRWRWFSTFLSLGILAAILLWARPDWGPVGLGAFITLWVASSVAWLVVNLVGLSRAKKDLARIEEGVSFFIDPEGLAFRWPEQQAMRWADIEAVTVVGGRGGAGPRLAVIVDGKPAVEVPLSMLDASPAVIDSTIRAVSLGAHHLDGRRLEVLT